MTTKPLLSSAEVAAALHVDRSTISRLVAKGKLRPVVEGAGLRGARFFRPSEVERFKRAHDAT